jgi:hypothetical protein
MQLTNELCASAPESCDLPESFEIPESREASVPLPPAPALPPFPALPPPPVLMHMLFEQAVPDGHTFPQLPQFDESPAVSMQLCGFPHRLWPKEHPHVPLLQLDPAGHIVQLVPQ